MPTRADLRAALRTAEEIAQAYRSAIGLRLRRGVRAGAHARARLPEGLNVVGFFRGALGLGESVRALGRALEGSDVPHVCSTIALGAARDTQEAGVALTDALPFSHTLLHVNPCEVAAYIRSRPREELASRRLIGLWYWELESVPWSFRAASLVFDEIWVASEWNRVHFAEKLHCPVFLFPFPIDQLTTSAPVQGTPSPFPVPEDAFVFLSVFDFYSVTERKNPLAAIDAYTRAFPEQRGRTRLVLKCQNGAERPADRARVLQAIAGRGDVIFHDGDLPRASMVALFERADCFVSLHRSEGLGLGILEAEARGKWVIMTDYAAPTEFRDLPRILPVPYARVPIAKGTPVYEGGGEWADPSIHDAAERMRDLVSGGAVAVTSARADDVRHQHSAAAFRRFVRARLAASG